MTFHLPPKTTLAEFSITISQEQDTCAGMDDDNALTISLPNGGAGSYIVIKGRWAMDDAKEIDELANFLKSLASCFCPGSTEQEPQPQ